MSGLVATFTKGGRVAVVEWSDGLVAEIPVLQHPKHHRMPHDLEHYVVDAGFHNVHGFWSLLSQQATYKSVRPLNGSWGRDRIRRSEALFAEREDDMNAAEAMTAPIRTLAHGDYGPEATAAILAKAPAIPRDRVDRVVAAFRDMERRWADLAVGETLQVAWPPDDA